tara:strand:- start:495 stop:1763 length:1269 start_codon:yes stop_codon:yes gene_type:complete
VFAVRAIDFIHSHLLLQEFKLMAGQSLLTFASEAIKLVYGDLHEQLRDKNPALQMIESSSANITRNGKEVIFDTHIGRNQGIGARGVREKLPTAGAQKYKQAHLYLTNLYGSIEVDGQLFEQAAEDYQAFINVVDMEITGLKRDLAVDLNRQVYGDGTGTIATVASVSGQNITVDSTHWVQESMILVGIDPGTGAVADSGTELTVTAINETTKVITVTGTISALTTADLLVRGSNTTNSYNKEWTGLAAIVGAGTLHEIDAADYPTWQSTVTSLASGSTPGTLTELALINLVQSVDKKGGDVDVMLASPGVFNAYWNLLQGLRQFTNGATLTGGQRAFSFDALGKPIKFVSDYAAPANTLYALSSKEIVLNRKKDWSWMDRDGSMWSRVADTDAYEARYFQYSQLGTYRRNAHAVMTGIAEL